MPRRTRPRNGLKLTIVNSVVGVIQWSENYVPHGRNHFSTVCRTGKPREDVRGIHEYEDDDSYEGSDYEFLSSSVTLEPINAVAPTSRFTKEIYTEMQINDKRVKFQIDCGATTNIIKKRHAGSNVTPSSKTLKMWNGTEVKPLGTTPLLLRNPKTKKKYSIKFVVVPDNLNPLIGAHTAQQMGLITVHTQSFVPVSPPERKKSEDINKIETAEQLIQQCPDVLSKDLGTLPGTVHLQVAENAKPSITPPRRVPTALREKWERWAEPTREPGSTANSRRAHCIGKHCCHSNQEIRCIEDLHWSPSTKPSPKKRKGPAASSRRLDAKTGQGKGFLSCGPERRLVEHRTGIAEVTGSNPVETLLFFRPLPSNCLNWKIYCDDQSGFTFIYSPRLPLPMEDMNGEDSHLDSQALEGLEGILNITDDILVYGAGDNEEEARVDHDRKLEALLNRCRNEEWPSTKISWSCASAKYHSWVTFLVKKA